LSPTGHAQQMNQSDDTENAATTRHPGDDAALARSRTPPPHTTGHSNQHGEHRHHTERRAASSSSLCRRLGSAEQPRTSSSTSATQYQQQLAAQRMWGFQEYCPSWPSGGVLYPMPVAPYSTSYPHAVPLYPRYFLNAQYPHVPPDCPYTPGMAYGYPMLHMQPDGGGQQVQPYVPPAAVRQGADGAATDHHRAHQRRSLQAPSLQGAAPLHATSCPTIPFPPPPPRAPRRH
jgi:hypothetical protein